MTGAFLVGLGVGGLGVYVFVGGHTVSEPSRSDCDGAVSVRQPEGVAPAELGGVGDVDGQDATQRLRALQVELEELRRETERLRAAAARRDLEDALDERRPRMYPLTREERVERIERCEYYTESPGELTDEVIDALQLTAQEQQAYAEALEVVSAQSTKVRNEVWRETYGTDVPTYDEIMKDGGPMTYLEKMQGLPGALDDSRLHRIIEEEHAGLRQRPADDALSPWARFKRAGIERSDRLQQELARRIGSERAHEIRAFDGGWPGGQSMLRGCSKSEP